MELYTLDAQYRRTLVIDNFESLIWTERFKAYGDFEVLLDSTRENRQRFPVGVRLAMNESYRVMTVETVEENLDNEGRTMLKVSGRSLERILEDRAALATLTNPGTNPKWSITGRPAAIVRKIYHDICVLGKLATLDIIPIINEGTIFPPSTIPEPTTEIAYEIEPTTVYSAMKELCDLYDIGFRIVRDPNTSQLYFDVYMGSDRTTFQTTYPAVVFSPNLENLSNTSELSTIENYKTVAYVISPVGSEVVYPPGVDPAIGGLNRRVLLVQADDIQEGEDPALASAKMIRKGLDELTKNRRYSAYDGEVSQFSQYKYGRDYNLGDLVDMQNVDGGGNKMQVTEQIFVSDREGERSYPTLSLNQFIMPGTWLAWDFTQVWSDLGPTEYWANQP